MSSLTTSTFDIEQRQRSSVFPISTYTLGSTLLRDQDCYEISGIDCQIIYGRESTDATALLAIGPPCGTLGAMSASKACRWTPATRSLTTSYPIVKRLVD